MAAGARSPAPLFPLDNGQHLDYTY